MNDNTGTLTYNQYTTTYTINYKIADFAFPTTIKFNNLTSSNPLRAAIRHIADLHEVYPAVHITINI